MERFEVFNRSIGQWESENIEIVPGWNENWVQDKTTDTMQLKVKYKSITAPNWKKNDWCRILHLENENNATYIEKTGNRIKKISTSELVIDYSTAVLQPPLLEYTFKLSDNTKAKYDLLEPINFTFEADGVEQRQGLYLPDFETTYIGLTVDNLQIVSDYIWVIEKAQTMKIPKNHEQFVIKDVTFVYNEIEEQWDCQLELQEPIEITNGISIETRSFTNQGDKIVDGITYKHEALNHLNVLETILKTTPANNDFAQSWFSRINILDKEFLETIPYNDETLSEQNLYGLLLDKYDNAVGRTPVLYFDIDNNDLPVNLEKDTYILDFLRQDGFDKESIELNDLLENHNKYIINKSGENFTDGLISNFDNLTPNKEATFVAENLWAIPEIDSNERIITQYGSSSDKGIWVLKIPQKIKKINLITRYHFVQSNNANNWQKDVQEIKVLERKQYTADATLYDTRSVDWYVEGENVIHLNDYYYRASSNTNTDLWLYRVNFEPLISGRYDLAKDYQTQINQNDSQIDNAKFGKYLKDYLASMNKADLIISKTVNSFNDIVELGTRVIDNSKNYLITNISIQNRGFDYDIVYQLNENHFRRNDSIVASQEIRKNVEIGIDATKERKSMLPYEFKLSLKQTNNENSLNITEQIYSAILTNYANKYPETALLYIKDENKIEIFKRLCNFARYVLNNTFCFNMTYFDNAEAGKQKNIDEVGTNVNYNGQQFYTTLQGSPNSQIPVLYTNPFGELPIFDVRFLQTNAQEIENVDLSSFTTDSEFGNYILNVIKHTRYSTSYPDVSGNFEVDFASEIANPVARIDNINYYKDMLDTFNYTIGFHVDSDENIILCQAFFNNSILITNTGAKISAIKTYSQNMTENDYGITNYVETSPVTGTLNGNEITIQLANSLNNAKSVILVDANNKPLLIINDFDKTIGNTFDGIKLYC